jgi:hypothetical protein
MAIKNVGFHFLPQGWKPQEEPRAEGGWIRRSLGQIVEAASGPGVQAYLDRSYEKRDSAGTVASAIRTGKVCSWCDGNAPTPNGKTVCPHWAAKVVKSSGTDDMESNRFYVVVELVKKG